MSNVFLQSIDCINDFIHVFWFLLIIILLIISIVSIHINPSSSSSSSFIRQRHIAILMEPSSSLQVEGDILSDKEGEFGTTNSPEKNQMKDSNTLSSPTTTTATTTTGSGDDGGHRESSLMDRNKEELLKEAIKKQTIQLNKYRTQLKSVAEECKRLIGQRDALEKIIKETTPFDTMNDVDGLGTFLKSSKEQNELLKNEVVRLKTQEYRLTEQLQESKEIIDLHHQSKLDAAKEYGEKVDLKDIELQQLRSQLDDMHRQLEEAKESQVSSVNLYRRILERLSNFIKLEGKHEMMDEESSLEFLLESLFGKFHEKESVIDHLMREKTEIDEEWQAIRQLKDERIAQLEKELQRRCMNIEKKTIDYPISESDEMFHPSGESQSYEKHHESKMVQTHQHELHGENIQKMEVDMPPRDPISASSIRNQSSNASYLSSQIEREGDISRLVDAEETDSSSSTIHKRSRNKNDESPDKQGLFIRRLAKKLRELDFIIDLPETGGGVDEDEFFENLFHLFKQHLHNYERKFEQIHDSKKDLANSNDLLGASLSEITALCGECERLRVLKSDDVTHVPPNTLQTLHELEKRNEQLLSELDMTRSDISSLHSNIERLENIVATSQEVQKANDILSQKQLELESAYDSLKSQLELLRLEKEAQSDELSKYQTEIITWEERLHTSESNFHRTTFDYAQKREEMLTQIHTLEGKTADLLVACRDKDDSLLKFAALEFQSKEHLRNVENHLEDISDQLRNTRQALDQEQSSRRQDAETYAARIGDLEQQLEDRRRQLVDLERSSSSSLQRANHELEEARNQLATHSYELTNLKTILSETNGTLHASQQRLGEMQASMNALAKERDAQQQRLSETQVHMAQHVFTEQELSKAKEEIVHLKSDVQRQLDDFRSKEIHLRSLNKVKTQSRLVLNIDDLLIFGNFSPMILSHLIRHYKMSSKNSISLVGERRTA
jgi:chromosome segregation ATPase